jgi:glycosyltransferase involved in cell wall biosynthesis
VNLLAENHTNGRQTDPVMSQTKIANGRPILSICIPTYNRGLFLENCLESIWKSLGKPDARVEICVSDNASTDNTKEVVSQVQGRMPVVSHRNEVNVGMAQNFLQVVSMASGEYVWLIGDDDLLMPNAISNLLILLNEHQDIDFFYVNANHLNASYLHNLSHPFNTDHLPLAMERFSKVPEPRILSFFELVSPRISFDFLGGIFLSVFRREKWIKSAWLLDESALTSPATFSHFDNTFPHLKIWANAFHSSRAYFNPDPLIVCITGVREWAPMMPLIMSVRLPEALKIYRECGMGWWRYTYCMNNALRNFGSDLANMYLNRRIYKFRLPFAKIIISSLPYPNTYFSVLYFAARRMRAMLGFRKF